ncbi:MAG: LysM peptidoglycan-binding domain-containing M23 family metallopeptidase [Pseudomonadota bacterium]
MKKLLLLSTIILAGCGQSKTPAGYKAYGVSNNAGSTGVHTVLAGDTVAKIADNYRIPMREIITVNNIQAPYVLNVGYRLKLPPPNEHQVRKNDSVHSIAQMYEVSVNRLVALNQLKPPYQLQIGQTLRLPTPTIEQKAVQKENLKRMEREAPTKSNARINPVQRETLGEPLSAPQMGQPQTGQVSPAVQTPHAKPAQVQQTSAARSVPKTTPKASGSAKYMRPVSGRVISGFGPKPGGLHNDGINIKASRGTPIRAAENGVVVYAGNDLEGYGNLVLVRHEGQMLTAYAHLDKMLIDKGATVKRGEAIGTVGSTGQVDTPQLHFEVRRGTKPLNPENYL